MHNKKRSIESTGLIKTCSNLLTRRMKTNKNFLNWI
jgi:hypothetical protein